jgi:GMP synthase (glutamine-hydrolysing)
MSKIMLILSCGSVHKRYGLESFATMFVNGCGLRAGRYDVIDGTRKRPPTDFNQLAGVIITGSQSMVTERSKWMERLISWVQEAMAQPVPILGVCFGHQLMAMAMGGTVDYHPQSLAVGTFDVSLIAGVRALTPLFPKLPATFPAHMYHAQVVLEAPAAAVPIGGWDHDPNCVLRYTPNKISVQYHPEFDVRIMEGFLKYVNPDKPVAPPDGRPTQELLTAPLRPALDSQALLPTFAAMCLGPAAIKKAKAPKEILPAPSPKGRKSKSA